MNITPDTIENNQRILLEIQHDRLLLPTMREKFIILFHKKNNSLNLILDDAIPMAIIEKGSNSTLFIDFSNCRLIGTKICSDQLPRFLHINNTHLELNRKTHILNIFTDDFKIIADLDYLSLDLDLLSSPKFPPKIE